ncbi:RIP metalloprotease RseP [Dechloromonas agitata]|uniref:RIP metalloprotease RseP n=1 Tax=Dechloromonas agitata TaxID=73030 RepID=UPI0004841E1A|nr:RIP metalloprotease RseP [Dechloromonas agitata]MDE1544156.1 RIP metalloprotease RseP [Dechloromonas agitata]
MSDLPFYLAAFAVVLGVLIVVHELGHFLVARWCGVKVLRFSVGFGRVLWQRRLGRDGTEWAVSAFPLGGYVKMLDEREGEVAKTELHRAFNRQSVGKRSLIVAAGPLANFALAILLYWVVFMYGSNELLPVLGTPPAGSPAAIAAITNGEQVRSVDGQPVATWNDLRWLLLEKAVDYETVEMELVNERGEIAFRRLALNSVAEQGWEGDALDHLGIRFFRPNVPPVIGDVVKGGPAATAGLLTGDRVVAVDGQPVDLWLDFVSIVRESGGRSLHLDIRRGDETLGFDIVPESVSERGRAVGKIGVAVKEVPGSPREIRTFIRHGFVESGRLAVAETWNKAVFSLVMMGKMLVGEVSWKNLSGPVTIADYAGQSARLGLDYYLKFMALVSISLGVLNLLPIPVLDGGHLLYHMIEVVRRRPLSERSMEVAQQVGMSLLFALMAFAFFNDIARLFNG